MGTIQNGSYFSQYTGDQIDAALGKALNPDTAPTADSANLITSGGVYNGLQRKSNPNLLDNWYFVGGGSQQGGGKFPINQRGQTSYSGQNYGIDRWQASTVDTVLSVNSDGIRLTSELSSGYCGISQGFEDVSQYVGQSVTGSILVGNQLLTGTIAFPSLGNYTDFNLSPTLSMQLVNIGAPYCEILSLVSDSGVIKAIKLELGDTQTLAHQENGVWVLNEVPNFQQELAKCQRYYQKIYCIRYPAVAGAPTAVFLTANLPVPMAKVPTAVPIENGGVVDRLGTVSAISNPIVANTGSNFGQIAVQYSASGLVAGPVYVYDTIFELSADL